MKSSIDYENTVGSTNPRYARTYVSLSHTHVAFWLILYDPAATETQSDKAAHDVPTSYSANPLQWLNSRAQYNFI